MKCNFIGLSQHHLTINPKDGTMPFPGSQPASVIPTRVGHRLPGKARVMRLAVAMSKVSEVVLSLAGVVLTMVVRLTAADRLRCVSLSVLL